MHESKVIFYGKSRKLLYKHEIYRTSGTTAAVGDCGCEFRYSMADGSVI